MTHKLLNYVRNRLPVTCSRGNAYSFRAAAVSTVPASVEAINPLVIHLACPHKNKALDAVP